MSTRGNFKSTPLSPYRRGPGAAAGSSYRDEAARAARAGRDRTGVEPYDGEPLDGDSTGGRRHGTRGSGRRRYDADDTRSRRNGSERRRGDSRGRRRRPDGARGRRPGADDPRSSRGSRSRRPGEDRVSRRRDRRVDGGSVSERYDDRHGGYGRREDRRGSYGQDPYGSSPSYGRGERAGRSRSRAESREDARACRRGRGATSERTERRRAERPDRSAAPYGRDERASRGRRTEGRHASGRAQGRGAGRNAGHAAGTVGNRYAMPSRLSGHLRRGGGLSSRHALGAALGVVGVVLVCSLVGRLFGGGARTGIGMASDLATNGNSPLFYANDSTGYAASLLLLPDVFAPDDPSGVTVDGLQTASATAGGAATGDSESPIASELNQAISDIENSGYDVGFVLSDLSSGLTISYNADTSFYSASSIKGPYVIGLAKYELGDTIKSEASRVSAILEYSDNNSYSSLRRGYGNTSFAQLVSESGAAAMPSYPSSSAEAQAAQVQSGLSISDNLYEFLTPRQMQALWTTCYGYLTSGSSGATWLGEELAKPETSAIRPVGSHLGTTWSKAGWYPSGSEGWGTTVDAGVIRTDSGDVVLTVMTSAPEDFGALRSVIDPLLGYRAELLASAKT